ncbi:hypothetical protein TWF225_010199 [Orbilia oligospora]|nr:hypothetical protein TWF225_010199 [Orbilia oligospora]KAF3249762.1 hypothetical protein TWF128_007762 [Orbilia oligospora]
MIFTAVKINEKILQPNCLRPEPLDLGCLRLLSLLVLSATTGLISVPVYAAPVPQNGLTQDQIDTSYINEGGYTVVDGKVPAALPNPDILGGKFATVVEDNDFAYNDQFRKEGKTSIYTESPQEGSVTRKKVPTFEAPPNEIFNY